MPSPLPVPPEVLALILPHLGNDKKSLKRVALVSHNLCYLAQELLFSTITVQDSNSYKLLGLNRIFQTSPRAENILFAIRTLSLRYCRKILCDSGFEAKSDLGTIQYIANHAKRLRTIHLGPFRPSTYLWSDQSRGAEATLINLLTIAEDIIIEGVHYFPSSLFSKLKNLKSLDFSGSSLSPNSSLDPSFRPSPLSLALHNGVLGYHHDQSLVADALFDFALLPAISFSNLKVLNLDAYLEPGRNALYRKIIALCDCKRLEALRFYIQGDDIEDHDINGAVIDLSRLTSLQSLYIMVNVNDSLRCLASIVDTLSLPQTHLEELALFINTHDSNMEEDVWLEEMMNAECDCHSESWETLDRKLAEIFKTWDDTDVFLQFPPVDPILREDVHDFIEDQFPKTREYMYGRFQLLDLHFRNIVTPFLNFREDEDQAQIIKEFTKLGSLE